MYVGIVLIIGAIFLIFFGVRRWLILQKWETRQIQSRNKTKKTSQVQVKQQQQRHNHHQSIQPLRSRLILLEVPSIFSLFNNQSKKMTLLKNTPVKNKEEYHFNPDRTKLTVLNNDPIDSILHVVCTMFNPCLYQRRIVLAKQFITYMEKERNTELYIVEIAYKDQKFYITEENNPKHLRLRVRTPPLWYKENAWNIAIRKLLPSNWKAVCCVDMDIEFTSSHWVMDTLKLLNGHYDIVQGFSLAIDFDSNEEAFGIYQGFGYLYTLGKKHGGSGVNNNFHPGYVYSMTRKAYETMGKIYEDAILGSGDNILALCLIGQGLKAINHESTEGYKQSVKDFQKKVCNLRFGYVSTNLVHYFHGSKQNRKYTDRWKILVKHKFDPNTYITRDDNGLIIPTEKCPPELLDDIFNYFKERNEDEV